MLTFAWIFAPKWLICLGKVFKLQRPPGRLLITMRVLPSVYVSGRQALTIGLVGGILAATALCGEDGTVAKIETNGAGAASEIGRRIFRDTGLSQPPGQGCISCHTPGAQGFHTSWQKCLRLTGEAKNAGQLACVK